VDQDLWKEELFSIPMEAQGRREEPGHRKGARSAALEELEHRKAQGALTEQEETSASEALPEQQAPSGLLHWQWGPSWGHPSGEAQLSQSDRYPVMMEGSVLFRELRRQEQCWGQRQESAQSSPSELPGRNLRPAPAS
jgi:hypothetical protein